MNGVKAVVVLALALVVSREPAPVASSILIDGHASAIVQQPFSGYVSEAPDEVTQYGESIPYGSLGLFGHSDRGGKWFYHLRPGDTVWVVTDQGTVNVYSVQKAVVYQVVGETYTNLSTGEQKSVFAVYQDLYSHNDLVLQTCFERDGNTSWGRLFVTAKLVNHPLKARGSE